MHNRDRMEKAEALELMVIHSSSSMGSGGDVACVRSPVRLAREKRVVLVEGCKRGRDMGAEVAWCAPCVDEGGPDWIGHPISTTRWPENHDMLLWPFT